MKARFRGLMGCIGVVVTLALGVAVARAQIPGMEKLKNFGGNPLKNVTDKVPEPMKKAVNDPNAPKVLKGAAAVIEGFTPEEERAIGEATALEIIGRYGGLVRDEEITRRVNLVGNALAYYSSRPVLNWKFAVLNSPSVNAFSAPGGFVFITRGLYEVASASDDLLAAVLAHEIGHITLRHALNIIARNEAASGVFGAVKDNTSLGQKEAELNQKQAQLQAQAGDFGIDLPKLVLRVESIVKIILEQGFDKDTEFAADKHARNLALTTGYAPGALRAVLVQLQLKKGDPKQLFALHPPLAERVRKLPADPLPKLTAPAAAAPAEPAKPEAKP